MTINTWDFDPSYVKLFTEIALICVVMLLVLLSHSQRHLSERMVRSAFGFFLRLTIGFVASDALWFIMDQDFLPKSYWALMLLKSLYFFFTTAMCFGWFLVFEIVQQSDLVKVRKKILLCLIPVYIQTALLMINPWTGWLFSTDSQMEYSRGPAFNLLYVLAYSYVIGTCGAAVYLYANLLSHAVSRDVLTGLNNRRQFLKEVSRALEEHGQDGKVFLFMIDLDHFKQINDKFGHLEGDNALLRVSDVLKKAIHMPGRRNVIARYGGDEFVILMENAKEEDEKILISQIRQELVRSNEAFGGDYKLELSIGAAGNTDTASIRQLLSNADENMYKVKERHHKMVQVMGKADTEER